MTFEEDLEFGPEPNYLITKQGRTVKCSGGTHVKTCKREFGCTIRDFIVMQRGCRVKAYGEEMAVEYHDNLSDKQQSRIRTILRKGDYLRLTTTQYGCRESLRPIRSM